MSRTTRFGISLGFVAAVGIAGAAFGGPGSSGERKPLGALGLGHGLLSRIVTAHATFQDADGQFLTRLIDAGTVTAVEASTVTIERADGETVPVAATDDTRITRDGRPAILSDVRRGDRAFIVRVDRGDGATVDAIRAVSPERMAEGRAWMDHAPMREHRERMRDRLREWRERMREEMAREGRAQA